MSDEKKENGEVWQQMDVGSLRKFVREDIPVASPAARNKEAEDSFESVYTRKHTPEESFRSFGDRLPGVTPKQDFSAGGTLPSEAGRSSQPGFQDAFPSGGAAGKKAGEPAAPSPSQSPDRPVSLPSGEKRLGTQDFTEERESARKQGYEEGFSKGMEEGQGQGFAAGHGEGFAAGREEGLAQGAAEGYDKGYEEGRAAGLSDLEARSGELGQLMVSMQEQWAFILGRYEKEIVSLATDIAETLVKATLAVDNAVVERAVLSALQRLPDPLKVAVAVHPEDYQQVEMARERFFEAVPELRQLDLSSDPGVGRGGCRITAASGSIREDLGQRLAVLKETLIMAADTGGG
ncbi:flagellar biosynthesis/type III secretory pathway protein FliH [Desulfobotulus alkaliphilus]|uniref:Flagellar assembly protein FliH n=1 Tax=Desulfobotulus alkaliphilus TaxID=622671 RepID=A0A562RTM7_9BACT|nr:FliH/SctL family protein [Desulfobotulus alkaliphilus]TWI72422.1 flagellar biosynthesis/type III secretory pathway protein FliH [Desulfobotulus alkaliphilus]